MLPACRSRSTAREPKTAPRIAASEARVDVIMGRTLVMPVTLEGAINPARPIACRLDDGRKLTPTLVYINSSPVATGEVASWVPDPGKWTTTPASAGARPAGAGTWAIVVDLPLDAIGQGLWVGGHRAALNWLPSPDMQRADTGPVDWSPPFAAHAQVPSLLRLAEPERISPVRRWRYRLVTRGLIPSINPALNPGGGADAGPDSFSDPIIESFAMLMECRWQVALASLWIADKDLCNRIKRRLTAVVDFGDGSVAPVWPVHQPDLDVLLNDLLNLRLTPERQIERAEAWLANLPEAAAWVIDDAGQRDAATGQPVSTCGVCNLSERDSLGWSVAGRAPGSPELAKIASYSAASVAATLTPVEDETPAGLTLRSSPKATTLEVHLGRWSATRPATLDRIPAHPPGIRIEPLRREWTLEPWLEGTTGIPADEAWSAAGLLYLDSSPAPDGSPGDRWTLFIECRSPAIGREETIRVWLGAYGAPSAVLKIGSSGSVMDEIAPKQGLEPTVRGGSITRQGDTWSARIPLPARCIEEGGTLRVGIERTDGRGRRTSWPRPMLPWQGEPGRIAVDTAAWSATPGGPAANRAGR